MKKFSLSLSFLFIFSSLLSAQEDADVEVLPEGLTIQSVEILPKSIELTNNRDYRQVLILGHLESGQIADLTRMSNVEGNLQHVAVSSDGMITPLSEGNEQVTFRFGDATVQLEVKVTSIATPPSNFVQDVQPVLSKMSCISINIGKFVFNVVHVYQTHLEVTLPAVFVTLPEPVKEFLFPNGTEITPGIMPALDKEKRRAEGTLLPLLS